MTAPLTAETVRPGDLPALAYGRARSRGLRAKALVVPYGWKVGTPHELAYAPALDEIKTLLESEGIDAVFADMVDLGEGDRPVAQIRQEDPDLIVCLGLGHHQASDFVTTVLPFRDRIPVVVWAYPPYEASGTRWNTAGFMDTYVAKGTFEELGFPFLFLWELAGAPRSRERLRRYARVAVAKRRLEISRIGIFGYVAWGMYTGMPAAHSLVRDLGCELVVYDQLTLVQRMERIPEQEAREYARQALSDWEVRPEVEDKHLVGFGRMTLALRDFAVRDQLDAIGVKCHLELSHDYGCAACMPLSLLGEEIDTVCESDVPQLVTQLIQRYLTGLPTVHADIQDFVEEKIAFGGCGLCPGSLCEGPAVAPWTQFYGGLQNVAPFKPGRVTLARLGHRAGGSGFRMHIAQGSVAEGEPIQGEVYGNSTVAGGWVRLDGDLVQFMDTAFGNHVSIVWGDCVDEIIELCGLLDIPVTVT